MEGTKTVPEKERNPSATYTLKSLKLVIQKLEKLKMANAAEIKQLKGLQKTLVNRWIGLELGED